MKLITFLGTGNYKLTKYYLQNQEKALAIETEYIQEALLQLVEGITEAIVVVTKEAKEKNWENQEGKGLKKRLDQLSIPYSLIHIPSGESDEEFWKIFTAIYESIEEEEELVVDITHSFRSIPFIVSSVLNFAKEMKNIQLKSIFYGSYNTENEYNPILGLDTYLDILDWGQGARELIHRGDYKRIKEKLQPITKALCKESQGEDVNIDRLRRLTRELEKFFNNLHLVRGQEVPENALIIQKLLKELDSKELELHDELKPFILVIEALGQPFEGFSEEATVENIYRCCKLCVQYNLYQQAYTLLRENFVTAGCIRLGFTISDIEKRKIIEDILNHLNKKETSQNSYELNDNNKKFYERFKHPELDEKAKLFSQIGNFRNDLNHAEYRSDSSKARRIIQKLEEFLDEFEQLYYIRKDV